MFFTLFPCSLIRPPGFISPPKLNSTICIKFTLSVFSISRSSKDSLDSNDLFSTFITFPVEKSFQLYRLTLVMKIEAQQASKH